ncbi:MAG TPA: hypothetical protein VJV22_16450 [Acidobacteriaceae bacterium]|nr:hypothetical protein [Acidobacteriaceae bacterium]
MKDSGSIISDSRFPVCPRCAQNRLVIGEFRGWFGRNIDIRFHAGDNAILAPLRLGVPLSDRAFACAECGLVWTELSTGVLQKYLERFGNSTAREWFRERKPGRL